MTLSNKLAEMKSLEIDPDRRGGVPCLPGTRFTVAQVLAELADGDSVSELVDNLDLDEKSIKDFLNELANMFNVKMK